MNKKLKNNRKFSVEYKTQSTFDGKKCHILYYENIYLKEGETRTDLEDKIQAKKRKTFYETNCKVYEIKI